MQRSSLWKYLIWEELMSPKRAGLLTQCYCQYVLAIFMIRKLQLMLDISLLMTAKANQLWSGPNFIELLSRELCKACIFTKHFKTDCQPKCMHFAWKFSWYPKKSAKQIFMVSNFLCLAALWNWALIHKFFHFVPTQPINTLKYYENCQIPSIQSWGQFQRAAKQRILLSKYFR